MTDNDFQGLFSADEAAELAAAAAAVNTELAKKAAELAAQEPKKDGLWYLRDVTDLNGHNVSIYTINSFGKTIATVKVDNDLEVPTEPLGQVPAGFTGHAITLCSADGGKAIATGGIAIRRPHKDGVHLDTVSIRSYVLPRLPRLFAELYGV
jgi:hypothetical protein